MPLKADNATDRAEQILLLSERLMALVDMEQAQLEAGLPLEASGASEELRRLANAYRLEMAQIRDDHSLIAGAPEALRRRLQAQTQALQAKLDGYLEALSAVRVVTEGLAQAIAEEVQRARRGPMGYGADGGYASGGGAIPVALDQRA